MTEINPQPAAPPTANVPAPGGGDAERPCRRTAQGKRSPLQWIGAAAAAIGPAAGLGIWVPWRSPPLLRPAGLAAGRSTASSVSFHWAGPLPDKYVVLCGGAVIGSVPGTVTSYRRTGLYPDTSDTYRLAAVRGGRRSVPSAEVMLRTVTPPPSAARWQGPWTVHVKIVHGGAALVGPRPLRWGGYWQASPQCAAGPCTVLISGTFNGYQFTATAANGGPDGAWTASAWAGTLSVSAASASTAAFYCNAFRLTAALSGAQ